MRKIALVYNPSKPQACSVRQEVETRLTAAGISVIDIAADRETSILEVDPEIRFVELAMVLGGDGTLLGVARQLAPSNIPLLGINVGHLGFLTESEPSQLGPAITRIIKSDYKLEKRMMLEAFVYRQQSEIAQFSALNDVGLGKGSFARMVTVDVHVDDVYLDTYRGDGVIISTPTGSTAYSLSCGGPIVSPHLQVMLVTPVCPHTLFSRPCVIDASQTVRATVQATHKDVDLSVDGQEGIPLQSGDEIIIRRAPYETTLVRWPDREFFSVLRSKLHNSTETRTVR
ncbi:NAD(+)/NADH kinase [Alicyclobacillus dauci]|uniref:NAD kinase n=1 Tax=Alicyclobacillus dauci TaxID=1475485 RepID=A0ABY6Z906_9BACL|nr:NAD(+)/NADH kinase [Alicyclobacillus dauci]WAH39018.1 NAD(+)/NADH kinase [Alicyclobacillus dauci]